jgi:hypothetical protein
VVGSEESRAEKVNVHRAEALTPQPVTVDETHRFAVRHDRAGGQGVEQAQHLGALGEGTGGEFLDHERVDRDLSPPQSGIET